MVTSKSTRTTPDRAIGIARISVNRANETSTGTQAERIEGWCASKGVELSEVIVVQGRSAYKTEALKRPDVIKALHLIRAGAVNVLVVWKIDRVARNARDLLNLIHEIEKAGGSFVSVTEDFNSNGPWARLVITILAAIAEMESAIKSERVLVWQEYRRASKSVPTGPRPFGYQRSRNALTIDQDEAKAVRKMAADVLAGKSLRSITAAYNATGSRTLTARGVVRILTSPTIAALRPVEGTILEWYAEGQTGALVPCDGWKPILDRPTWEAVHKILLNPSRRTNHTNGERVHLLSGLLECGKCGKAMAARGHLNGPRYTCPTYHLSIPAAETDREIERAILDLLDPLAWQRLRSRGTHRVDIEALDTELAELAQRRFLPPSDPDYVGPAEHETLRKGLTRQRAETASEPLPLPNIDNVQKRWPHLTIEQKRLIVTATLPRIVIKPAVRGLAIFDESRIVPEPSVT
jgi:site-specific DNA recombinase